LTSEPTVRELPATFVILPLLIEKVLEIGNSSLQFGGKAINVWQTIFFERFKVAEDSFKGFQIVVGHVSATNQLARIM
jgi:hypothetical protein